MKKCFVCKHTKFNSGNTNKLFYEKGQILIIKNIPCFVCENCGEIYLTNEIILEIEKFLDTTELPEIEVINYEKIAA